MERNEYDYAFGWTATAGLPPVLKKVLLVFPLRPLRGTQTRKPQRANDPSAGKSGSHAGKFPLFSGWSGDDGRKAVSTLCPPGLLLFCFSRVTPAVCEALKHTHCSLPTRKQPQSPCLSTQFMSSSISSASVMLKSSPGITLCRICALLSESSV